jgi:cell fate regulator YaaT (PSP1 superfamily)
MFRATVRYGRLRHLGEFSPADEQAAPRANAACVVRTDRGLELGTVLAVRAGTRHEREFVRVASADDLATARELEARTKRVHERAREHATKLGLSLHVLGVDLPLSAERLVLHYSAEERLDLRELARLLQGEAGTKVELRQLGARERARACGGAGVCGRTLCCSTFLRELEPVTLRMAKVQGFSLAPDQTSGACGRLKCCLRYENPLYEESRAYLPRKGMHVEARRASGEVVSVDVLERKVTVRTRDGWLVHLYAAEISAGRATMPVLETDSGPEKRDSRWRGITDRLNIFRRRPGRLPDTGGPGAEPPNPSKEKPS